jgi:hypothetical protein
VGSGINISGRDTNNASQETHRVLIENNVLDVTGLNGADARILQVLNGPVDVTIRHNTGLISVAGGAVCFAENTPKADQFDFRDNIFSSGGSGFTGTGTVAGTSTLTTWYTNFTFTKNALIGGSGSYPTGNFFPANTSAVGFVNFAGGDYRLTTASAFHNAASDGKDLGADIAAMVAAGAGGVLSGIPAPANTQAQ